LHLGFDSHRLYHISTTGMIHGFIPFLYADRVGEVILKEILPSKYFLIVALLNLSSLNVVLWRAYLIELDKRVFDQYSDYFLN
jgi:hypothetical protein